ncbi:hypothetical protein B1no1_29210 [Thermolongibacillus altinsuensis]|nr:hypothetical protein B1no1_29210 [Thermolongibacillus altinsuensis]
MLIKPRTYRRLLRTIFKLHTNKNCVDLIDIILSKKCVRVPGLRAMLELVEL